MAFEIEEFTPARLDDIEVLSQKNRQPDEAPGVKLHLEMTVANHVLTTLDGALKGMLFTRNEAAAPKVTKRKDNQTGDLDGVEPVSDMPNLSHIGANVKALKWSEVVTGCMAVIRFATTEMPLDDCSCGPFTIRSKEGGTSVIKFPIEAPNASEKLFAKLAKYKSREIEVKLGQHAPAGDKQQSLDDRDPAPAKEDKKDGGPWPFPKDAVPAEPAPQSVTTEAAPEKPRRGRRVVTTMD